MDISTPFTIEVLHKDCGKDHQESDEIHHASTSHTATGTIKGEPRQIEEAWQGFQSELRNLADQEFVTGWHFFMQNGYVEKVEVLTMMKDKESKDLIIKVLLQRLGNYFSIPLDAANNRTSDSDVGVGGKEVSFSEPSGDGVPTVARMGVSAQQGAGVAILRKGKHGQAKKEVYAHRNRSSSSVVGAGGEQKSSREIVASVVVASKRPKGAEIKSFMHYMRLCLMIRRVPLFASIRMHVKGQSYRYSYQTVKLFRYVKYAEARLHIIRALRSRHAAQLKRYRMTANHAATILMRQAVEDEEAATVVAFLLHVNPDEMPSENLCYSHFLRLWEFTDSSLRKAFTRKPAFHMEEVQTSIPMDEFLHHCLRHKYEHK